MPNDEFQDRGQPQSHRAITPHPPLRVVQGELARHRFSAVSGAAKSTRKRMRDDRDEGRVQENRAGIAYDFAKTAAHLTLDLDDYRLQIAGNDPWLNQLLAPIQANFMRQALRMQEELFDPYE